MTDDRRLIEDYLPIEKISAEASREKSVRKGHISTLHLWWARRPLVACRAAVYGALVPGSRFVPNGASDSKKKSLGRANAAKFIERLCQYPGNSSVIAEAQQHILEAHAERLTQVTGKRVTVEDIVERRATRPKVLDMFAGGGAIPLEALRLGCEAYALELNPVAHIIELCTLVYPQKYGKPDPSLRGMTGPRNIRGETTWGGLAEEIRYWGSRVLKQVKVEIGDLYPPIPNPEFKRNKNALQASWFTETSPGDAPEGYLMPIAYLWTRTVTCKNPRCRAIVPLVKRSWLRKKQGRYVALKIVAPKNKKQVRFEIVEPNSESDLGSDPSNLSKAGNATCSFCGTVADSDYVMAEGCANRVATQPIAVVCARNGASGKVYLSPEILNETFDEKAVCQRIETLCKRTKLTVPEEPISPLRPSPNARGLSGLTRYGVDTFGKLFTSRQQLLLLTLADKVRNLEAPETHKPMLTAYLGLLLGRVANQNCAFTVYNTIGEKIEGPMGDKKVPMVWDFPETNPFSGFTGGVDNALDWIVDVVSVLSDTSFPAHVQRGDATKPLFESAFFDAVITDPPYYDNVPYADIADFFYVWLKRSIGPLFPEHFSSPLSPKKTEATALASMHGGDMKKATTNYEDKMLAAFKEAHRVLKAGGLITVVYAHKTTVGWSTLVDAFRQAGFEVMEAWPVQTEMPAGKVKIDKAMLASSIFLIARKRIGAATGKYEEEVRPELATIVRERVHTLWEMGVSGADLVIACVGAGLRAFTHFAVVEYANGEEVPAQRFLTEVETVVLETILTRLSKEVGGEGGRYSLAGLDTATRFYVLWRYTYKAIDLDAGEAIIFANGTHVELEGAHGLSSGSRPLVVKNKSTYHLSDYTERGDDDGIGMPSEDEQSTPLIDTLHRLLWLMERRPSDLGRFLREARPNTDQLRLVAQALSGPALKGGELGEVGFGSELAALTKLMSNWRSVVEDVDLTHVELKAHRAGQSRILFDKGGRR